jgi:hypothetical protein
LMIYFHSLFTEKDLLYIILLLYQTHNTVII